MKILVAPNNCMRLTKIVLPQPKSGSLQVFFYDEDDIALYEVTRFHDRFRSCFVDNLFCKDGHYNMLTKIDPLYIFIPHLIKFASEHFRTLQDICSTFASHDTNGSDKLDYALKPDIKWNHVCDTKEFDDELFVRFNEKKTLDWLLAKHNRTVKAFKQQLEATASKATLISYATFRIDRYLPSSISDKFKSVVRANSEMAIAEDDTPRTMAAPPTKRTRNIFDFFGPSKK